MSEEYAQSLHRGSGGPDSDSYRTIRRSQGMKPLAGQSWDFSRLRSSWIIF
jgi:hypothetical protein